MEFSKASFGKTASKSGGGKFQGLTKGGAPSGLPGKGSLGRVSGGIDKMTTKGSKGIPPGTPGKGSSKAPKD